MVVATMLAFILLMMLLLDRPKVQRPLCFKCLECHWSHEQCFEDDEEGDHL